MPYFVKITPVPEITMYRDLVQAESLEEAEAGNYTIIAELEPELTGDVRCVQGCGAKPDEFEEADDCDIKEGLENASPRVD